MDAGLGPLAPVLVADRFAPLGDALLGLLAGLDNASWQASTVCADWTVKDVAAHLLDGACRRLSFERDRHTPPTPLSPLRDEAALLQFVDDLNASWVEAARRFSPTLLIELLAAVEPLLAAHVASVDPFSGARFPVSWAGETTSLAWFDVARELTERWHHQQQIRLAVSAAPLDDPFFLDPVLDTLLRALPQSYRDVEASNRSTLVVRIRDRDSSWTLRREMGTWVLLRGAAARPSATLALDQETLWRLLTRGIAPAEARRRSTLTGSATLARPFFTTLSVMALPRNADRA